MNVPHQRDDGYKQLNRLTVNHVFFMSYLFTLLPLLFFFREGLWGRCVVGFTGVYQGVASHSCIGRCRKCKSGSKQAKGCKPDIILSFLPDVSPEAILRGTPNVQSSGVFSGPASAVSSVCTFKTLYSHYL